MSFLSLVAATVCRNSAARPSVWHTRKCRNAQKSSGFRASGTSSVCIKDHVLIDPACGSGNFLTETFLSIRRLENEAIKLRVAAERKQIAGQITFGMEGVNPVKVSISQFYGIEINDFAVRVAQAALWIAESQMLKETEDIVYDKIDFLPLKTNANIIEGNALRTDWAKVVDPGKLSYIMGNPPFVGYAYQTPEQKMDLRNNYPDAKNIDYVAGWYFKASQMMQSTGVRAAFVSTNSICQGEQVSVVWRPLFVRFGIHIDFAHRTFVWDSEANDKAQVHCVIVGFSCASFAKQKYIYENGDRHAAEHINAYLLDADDVFVQRRPKPLCNVPSFGIGNMPIDDGNYLFTAEERDVFLAIEPAASQYFHTWYDSRGFINNRPRYCLWLGECSPAELRAMPHCMQRIQNVKEFRSRSKRASTLKYADRPTRFPTENIPNKAYIVAPEVSSQNRRYIPMGMLSAGIMCSNKLRIMTGGTLYHFGVLESNVHMAWMRAVCGRLKSDYDYSIAIVYNCFPWTSPTEEQKAKIEKTAQGILDARALYPDSSLADLYDPLTMPPELQKAHSLNDAAVMQAYGMPVKTTTEADCVAWLMRMYQELVEKA